MSKSLQRTSYRDPNSSVRVEDGRLTRTFSREGEEAFRSAHDAGVLPAMVDEGLLVPYSVVTENRFEVQSELIPFVSYPSEWTASMLRDAGVLTLALARRLLAAGFHLRDSSAYNVVFRGADPVFVDLGSIGMGQTPLWTGYGQFCDHFLNPLLVEAKLDVPFRELWTLEGVSVGTTSKLLRGRRSIGSGAFRNVKLRARLESDYTDVEASVRTSARRDLSLRPEQVDNIMAGLARTLESMDLGQESHWSDYETTNSYNESEEAERDRLIREFCSRIESPRIGIDVGTNAGRHAAVMAESFETVVALDSDSSVVDIARTRFSAGDSRSRIFPVVGDLADPTPGRGLMNDERNSLLDRLEGCDATLWMAVIHHLAIGRSIPLLALADLAAMLSPDHLIEFVTPEDQMCQLLIASRGGEIHPYSIDEFVSGFGKRFEVTQVGEALQGRPIFDLQTR